jgi:hypothetical protein
MCENPTNPTITRPRKTAVAAWRIFAADVVRLGAARAVEGEIDILIPLKCLSREPILARFK